MLLCPIFNISVALNRTAVVQLALLFYDSIKDKYYHGYGHHRYNR